MTLILLLPPFLSEKAAPQFRFLENGNPSRGGDAVACLREAPSRKVIDLSGLWSYQINGRGEGAVRVPCAYDFVGKVTFQRTFAVTADELSKYQFHLVMLGSNYQTDVALNTNFVTTQYGGYSSFIVPIETNYLLPGSGNVIKVTTDNALDATRTLPLRSQVWGWKNYGGILRDICILATPKVFVSDVATTCTFAAGSFDAAKMKVTVSIGGSASNEDLAASRYKICAELYEVQSGALVATSNTVSVAEMDKEWAPALVELTVQSPRLWSPETPNLYSVKTILADSATGSVRDEMVLTTGIRKVEIANGKILVNGKKVQLKGLIWMEDHPQHGSAMSTAEMEKDMAMIHSLGANAVRYGHHPPHPYMLTLCDRYGMFALVEMPVKNVPASVLAQEHFVELASERVREMIVRDRNHPSVLAWGLGDEFESWSANARSYVEPIAQLARHLDTRPLYYASHVVNDSCSDLVDINAITLTTQDIKEFKKQFEDLQAASSTKPLIIIKMGSEVQQDNNNGYADPLSHQAQARYYLQHYDVVRLGNIDGAFIWSFNDWKGDRPALTVNSGDPWLHTMGLVSYSREKRIAYDAVRSAFAGDKYVSMQMGGATSSAPVVYVLSGLVLLVGTAYLYNANRRFRDSLNRSMVNTYNFFADIRDQRVVTILHSTTLGLIVSAATAIVLSSLLYHFRTSIPLDNLLSYVLVSDNVKETVVKLIRNPQLFVLVFAGVFFLLLMIVFLLLWLLAPLFRARIFPYHAYATTMWSTPPLLVLVPLGMILYRLIDSKVYVLPSIVLCCLLFAWVFIRLLKAVAIILDSSSVRVYAVGFLSFAAACAGVYFYLDQTQSVSAYVNFFYKDIVSR